MWGMTANTISFSWRCLLSCPKRYLRTGTLIQSRIAAEGIGFCVVEDAGDEVHLAILQARLVFDAPLSDGGLVESADIPARR